MRSSEADLATTGFDEACSAPVRSDDGQYVALDLCPTKKAGTGKIVRLNVTNGSQTVVATYPVTDRVERIVTKGNTFVFAIRHGVDSKGRATKGIDVHVHDWALEKSRTVAAPLPDGGTGKFTSLGTLLLSANGSHVAFAAADGDLAKHLVVSSASGTKVLELETSAAEMQWSTAGNALVGHAPGASGETLYVVDLTAAGGVLSGKRRVDYKSSPFGEGGTRPQHPFDGTRVLGLKRGANGNAIGSVDVRTGTETVLDTAPVLRLVSDVGPDVLYATVTEKDGTFTRSLVKQARTGGAKKVLVSSTAPAQADLLFGFEPLALSTKWGLFYTVTGGAKPSQERWLVKLDGSKAEKLDEKVTVVGTAVGERIVVVDATGSVAELKTLDLATGTFTSLGAYLAGGPQSILAGDGSVIELEDCKLPTGGPGLAVRRISAGANETLPCALMPWAEAPIATPGSGALVFYSAWGAFPDDRYSVGIVNP